VAVPEASRIWGRSAYLARLQHRLRPRPYLANYAAAKAYNASLGQALNYELKQSGVEGEALVLGEAEVDHLAVPHTPVERPLPRKTRQPRRTSPSPRAFTGGGSQASALTGEAKSSRRGGAIST
jgi:hypothetical protein